MALNRCIVVGTGIVGLAVASALAVDGWAVLAIAPEPPPDGVATTAAGAMLGVLSELTSVPSTPAEQLELDLRLRAGAMYEGWLRGSTELVGASVPAGRGMFVVAGSGRADDRAALEAMQQVAAGNGLHAERVASDSVPGLSGSEEPAGVLHLADEGWVDAVALHAALRASCVTRGVAFAEETVTQLVVKSARVCGVQTRSGIERADDVVLCAGVAVRDVLEASRELGEIAPPLVRAKGVGLVLARPRTGDPAHVLRTPNREFACGLHVVPGRLDGTYVGATNRASRHRGATGRTTPEEVVQLVEGVATELVGDLGSYDIRALRFGERPLTADRLPIAGRTSVEGLSLATGTYRNGVLLAPLVGAIVAADLARSAADPDNPLSPVPGYRPRQEPPDPGALLQEGLLQIQGVLRASRDRGWKQRVERGLAVLQATGELPAPSAELLRTYPLVEMVPELLIELGEEAGTATAAESAA